jgi:hypothetical protein
MTSRGLTFEHPAHCVEGGEAHGLAPVLEHGDVRWGDADLFRELSDRHLAAREHDVDVDDDRHHTTSSSSRRSIVALRNRDPHDHHQQCERRPADGRTPTQRNARSSKIAPRRTMEWSTHREASTTSTHARAAMPSTE